MDELKVAAEPQVIRIGPDRITINENEVIIDARHRMPEWKVRELNPIPVYFRDGKYQLVQARKGVAPYEASYVLLPWPEGLTSSAKGLLTYDEEAVASREGTLRTGRFEDLVKAFLIPLYPFLGLLWSKTQRRLSRFGFVPHTISGLSVFLVFCLLFGQGVFAVVTINASVRAGKMLVGGFIRALCNHDTLHLGPVGIPIGALDCLLAVALLADLAMRYSYYLREHDWCGGFLEWLVRRGGSAAEVESAG